MLTCRRGGGFAHRARTALIVLALVAVIASPGPLALSQERGGGEGGRGEGGPGEVVPRPELSLQELVRQLVRETQEAGGRLFRELETGLLGRSDGPRFGAVALVGTPQGRSYVFGLIHEDLAAPGPDPDRERRLGILVWGPADGRGTLSALEMRGRGLGKVRFVQKRLVGTGGRVVWQGDAQVNSEWIQGADLRPNYIPRIVCMVTVDLESENWPGFVPASEEGNLPTGLACVDIGWIAATGSSLRVASWKIPGSVWQHEAVFRMRTDGTAHGAAMSGIAGSMRRYSNPLNHYPQTLGVRATRESWMLWAISGLGRPGVLAETVIVRDARPSRPVLEVGVVNLHADPPMEVFTFTQQQDGTWRVLPREVRRDGSVVEGRPSLVEHSGHRFAVCCGKPVGFSGQRAEADQRPSGAYLAAFRDQIWVAVDARDGQALTIKTKSTPP